MLLSKASARKECFNHTTDFNPTSFSNGGSCSISTSLYKATPNPKEPAAKKC